MMRNVCLFLLIISFITLPFMAQAEELSLTLDEAITIALRDNRDILLKAEDVKKAKAKIAEAQSSLLPVLNLSAGWTDVRELYPKDFGTYSTQAGVKQILYKGGKIINAIKAGEYSYIASEAVLDKTKLETVLNVKKAFYTLLLSDRFVEINKAILDNTQEHLDFIRARFNSGEVSESDVIKMRSAKAAVLQAYEASLNQTESVQALLNNLLFFDKEVKIKPSGQFTYEPQEIAYDEAFLKAMQSRPEIRQLEAQRNAAEKGIEMLKADSRPTVSASWDYYSSSNLASQTTKNYNDYNVLGITVSWPIFDGWLTKSKVEQAIIDLKEVQLLKEKTIKDIALELKTAYLDLKNALEKIKSVNEEISVYKDNLSVIEEKYKAGITSLLDLHDARLSYAVALFNQNQADYDYVVAKAKFDKATGGQL
jgi:outer membrane protein TolC